MTYLFDKKILKITPYPDELIPYKKLECPICQAIFLNSGNLLMHLARHHKHFQGSQGRRLEALPKTIDENIYQKLYYCPVEDCIYNEQVINGGRYFTSMKYIRQHYQKVHIVKSFECKKCTKAFATIGAHSAHELICGKKFECLTCSNIYTTREALLTHIKRKKHQSHEKIKKRKVINIKEKIPILQNKNESNNNIHNNNIEQTTSDLNPNLYENANFQSAFQLPKFNEIKVNPVQYIYLVKVAFEAKDQESQTDVGPQEVNSFFPQIIKLNNNLIDHNTMTEEIIQENFIDETKQQLANEEHIGNPHNYESYYEDNCFDSLVNESNLCDIETQTEITSVLDQLLHYSNTHTQTCDEFLQELCLADIQTQTNWSMSSDTFTENNKSMQTTCNIGDQNNSNEILDISNSIVGAHDELLVSTETQTSFTQCLLEFGESGNIANATSSITQHTQTDQLLLDGLFESQDDTDFISNFQSTQTQT